MQGVKMYGSFAGQASFFIAHSVRKSLGLEVWIYDGKACSIARNGSTCVLNFISIDEGPGIDFPGSYRDDLHHVSLGSPQAVLLRGFCETGTIYCK